MQRIIATRTLIAAMMTILICALVTACSSGSSSSHNTDKHYDIYRVEVKTTLNMRASPSKSARVIGQLRNGDIIYVTNISDGWAKAEYKGHTGYVSADYITLVEKDHIETAEEQEMNEGSNVRHARSELSKFDELATHIKWDLLSDLTFWLIVGVIVAAFVIAIFVGNDWLKLLLSFPAKCLALAILCIIAFSADFLLRLIDIINPLNWIIGWIAGDDVTFWTIVMVVFSDWMGLAAFALIICWGMILVNKGLEISYLPKLIGDLLTLPVLILFMVWQYKYFEEFFYGIPNYYVLYSVGLLAWLFACFAPSDFLDD